MMKRLLFRTGFAVLLVFLSSIPARANVTLNSNNFPDANFMAALSTITGVAVGGSINESTLTELDVSNKGITSIEGIELLTALTKFVAAHNDIKFANITNNPHLEWLDLSYNSSLKGFNSTSGSGNTSTNWITLTNNMPLTHLDLSNCNIGYFQAIYNGYHVNTLTWLSLANNPAMNGWSPGITAQTGLVYCDLTNTAQTSSSVGFTSAHNKLETLILANNSNFGWSESFKHLRALKFLDISSCDLYFRKGTDSEPKLLYYLTPANNPHLETLLANNSQMGSLTEGLTGFPNLKTVDISGNPNVTHFWVNQSPLLEELNVTGLNKMTYLELNNDALPRSSFTLTGAGTCSVLSSLYLNGNRYSSVGNATTDFSDLSAMRFLYLENNNFGGGELTLTAADCSNLTGLDLGNNGFTSFNAPSLPSTLTALMLGDNTSMERLEMHNNPGIITMTASPTMSDGSGLYLLGNTALHYMDISGTANQPNYFQRIGNNFSLQGVPIDTLKASHNKFYTFRNLTTVSTRNGWEVWKNGQYGWIEYNQNYNPASDGYVYGYWPPSPAQPDSASLEQLTNLKYLDLSYCNLKDSVHLHKNRELLYLDLSHNRKIERHYEVQNPPKGQAYRDAAADGTTDKRSFPDYKIFLWVKEQGSTGLEPYTGDYNDTIGIYDLDLAYNNKLEYLDISYTGIEQTAARHCYVANARYVWIQDLPNLKYFYADYNGMRSMGIGTKTGRFYQEGLKSLERLSVIGMRGTDCKTMQGSMNYASPYADTNPSPCVNLHYINLSYSKFDSIGVKNPHVDTLIVRGNPIHYLNVQGVDSITYIDARECAFKMRGYDVETGRMFFPDTTIYKNGARENGSYTKTIQINGISYTVPTEVYTPFSGLRGIKAYGRPKLTTVLLDNCNALTNVYCHHDPLLEEISGFDKLAYNQPYDASFNFPTTDADSLSLVYVNDNKVFKSLDLTHNANLKYLHAYNDSTLGTTLGGNGLDLTANKNLVSAWVSNSRLERFVNDAGQHLDTLKIWQNPELDHLDVSDNGNLRYFDLRNCMIRTLNLDNNKKLTYFDCSNRDSIWTDYEHFTFNMPGSVPTVIDDPGKNSIADLHFKSDSLRVVHADNNDLYCMDGLSTNHKLYKLTYSYNHINAIDLSGCDSLVNDNNYNCYHNVRGLIPGELSSWKTTENNVTTEHNLYYFQLEENAGDGLNGHNTFLGIKCGQDSLLSDQTSGYERQLAADGFDPNKVLAFTTNASGPHHGSRTPASGAPMRVNVDPSEQLDPDSFYGTIAILDKYDLVRNYIEYRYNDQRPSHRNRDGGGSAFGIAWNPPGTPTVVDETAADNLGELTVVGERYFDAAGAEHSEPVSGVNIIVRQMSDGSTETVKVIK